MSNNRILTLAAFGLVFISTLVLSGTKFFFAEKYNDYLGDIPSTTDEVYDWAKTDKNHPCYRLLDAKQSDSNSKGDCAKEATKEAYEYIKDKRDLKAQEGMWRAATELLTLTAYQLAGLVISTLFTIFGFGFLYYTLLETKKQTALSFKPYFSVTNIKTLPFIHQDGRLILTISFDIKNIGKSMASDVSDIRFSEGKMKVDEIRLDTSNFIQTKSPNPDEKFIISPEESIRRYAFGYFKDMTTNPTSGNIHSWDSFEKSYRFVGSFTYRDIESGQSLKRCEFVVSYNWYEPDITISFEANVPKGRIRSYENYKKE